MLHLSKRVYVGEPKPKKNENEDIQQHAIDHFSTHFSLYDHLFWIKICIERWKSNLKNENKQSMFYQYDIEKVAMMVWIEYECNSQQY